MCMSEAARSPEPPGAPPEALYIRYAVMQVLRGYRLRGIVQQRCRNEAAVFQLRYPMASQWYENDELIEAYVKDKMP